MILDLLKNKYRIFNRITQEWWEGEAKNADEACRMAGWIIGNCWVRQYTIRGGWRNITKQIKKGKK